MPVFDYDPPERFVAGAVGQPGSRAFFLQARGQGRLTTVALEKFQVAALADRLDELLDEVLRRGEGDVPMPAVQAAPADNAPLDVPISEDFRVGAMALAWDSEAAQVVIEAQEAVAEEEEFDPSETDEPTVLRVHISPVAARAFTRRALALVAAGRPPCPLCAQPLDPEGHICVRLNGYRGNSASAAGGGE
ncbi:DUF3090 domain-containing protein [Streptosporangium sp. NPDC050855]|uniref:DUF3090 domain-containing protein n=1 Tax=Streptosporangium sp. NPDC050855 TaxID=3366194 RepID=UPI00378CA75C